MLLGEFWDEDGPTRWGSTRYKSRARDREKAGLPITCIQCGTLEAPLHHRGRGLCTPCFHVVITRTLVQWYVAHAIEHKRWPRRGAAYAGMIENHFMDGRSGLIAMATEELQALGEEVPYWTNALIPEQEILAGIVAYVELWGEFPSLHGGFYWLHPDKAAQVPGMPTPFTAHKRFGGVTMANHLAWDLLPKELKKELPRPRRYKTWEREDVIDTMMHYLAKHREMPLWKNGAGRFGGRYKLTYLDAIRVLGLANTAALREFAYDEARRRGILDAEPPSI